MRSVADQSSSPVLPARVRVSAEAHHLPQYSQPGAEFFAYVIRLENEDDQTWRLLRRYWLLVDARGECTEIEGEGVVGQQPLLTPGTLFMYDSFVQVAYPPAQMSGVYLLENAWGEQQQVSVPEFRLDVGRPFVLN